VLRRWRRFLAWPVARQWWLLQLFVYGGLAKLAIPLVPFRWLARYLGEASNALSATALTPVQREQAQDIGRLTRMMAALLPWESQCLVQVLAARTLLARQGIPWVARFGVKIAPDGTMHAHAWLLVDGVVIIGKPGHRTFTVVGSVQGL